ncbi:MAG: aminopeptidase P family protein [Oscillospiraceae bacterium]|nr:aminopeptidase P family protein [Oscillospiraceae bacterium]
MRREKVYAVIIPTSDFHGSEYVGEYFKLREYLSGFTGSAGTLVVTLGEAALWTDSRYFLQAERELSGSGIELMKMGESSTPKIEKFLLEKMPENSTLGFDGRTLSCEFAKRLSKTLSEKNISVSSETDYAELVWKDRPPLSAEPVFELPEQICGVSRAEKLSRIREKMKAEHADCLVISALDEIAWTLNLRGNDIEFCPLFLGFMMIFSGGSQTKLFADKEIFSDEIIEKLKADGVEIYGYGEVYSALGDLSCNVWADPKAVNHRFLMSLEDAKIIEKTSPVEMMKAVKNPTEISCEKNAHLKDGVAVTRFMKWLKTSVSSEKITELSAAEKLEGFRKLGENYLGQSFSPIMAYGAHGAIVHYSASEETNAVIEPRGMLLSDTGGHYLDGTTDITRTIVLGDISQEEKRAFTLVLAGHLNLLAARFPEGTRGSALDYAAREPLWQNGLDFGHGTGHGVGFLLNVHEGPQRISFRAQNDAPMQAGMITSDEPGIYIAGKYGIRHESLLLCEKDENDENKGFLRFSPLTLVPFDRDGINKRYLSERQVGLLNDYHRLVFEKLSPLLGEEEKKWLEKATEPI